jgi:hypothetical protein
MKVLSRGVLAATLASALLSAPAVAAPADVTVRVEGSSGTLLAETPVRVTDGFFAKDGGPQCSRTSAAGALEAATGGAWGGGADASFGQRVETIRGETHVFTSGVYWSLLVNDVPASLGACQQELQTGDEVLLAALCEGPDRPDCFTEGPLALDAPRTARPGVAFAVGVNEVTTVFTAPDFAPRTTRTASAGATVAGGGATATTGADGRATLTLAQRGEVVVTATRGDRIRESRTVCVTDGADGFCGTAVPGRPEAPLGGPGVGPCVTSGSDGRCGTTDREAPRTVLQGLREQARFTRARAPRVLRGTVTAEASGVRAVALRLTRTDRGRCTRYDFARERFVRAARCGARGAYATVGDRATFEYQLAARLPRGRYVLDARATDAAGNVDFQRRRGDNRVVFFVR